MIEQMDFLKERRIIRKPVIAPVDVCANRHGGNVNSRAANVLTDKARDTAAIIAFLRRVPDATCDEVEVALSMKHQTCSARFSDLKKGTLLLPTQRRPTRSGCMAQAYTLSNKEE